MSLHFFNLKSGSLASSTSTSEEGGGAPPPSPDPLSLIDILAPAYGFSTGDPAWADPLVDGGTVSRIATRSSIDNKAVGIVPTEGLKYPSSRFASLTWDGVPTGSDYVTVTSSFKSAIMASLRMVLTFEVTMPDYTPTGLFTADKATMASQWYSFSGGKRWAFGINQAGYLYVELDTESTNGTFPCNADPGFANGSRYAVQADIVYNASNPGTLNGVNVTFKAGPDRNNLTTVGTSVSLGGYEGGWGHSHSLIAVGAVHGGYYNNRTHQFKGTIHNMTISDGTTETVNIDYENMDSPYSYQAINSTWVTDRSLNDPYDLGRLVEANRPLYTSADASFFDLPTVGVPPGSGRYAGTGMLGLDNNNPQTLPGSGIMAESYVWLGWGTKTSSSGYAVPGPYGQGATGWWWFGGNTNNTMVTVWGNGGFKTPNDPGYLVDTLFDGNPHLAVAVRVSDTRWELYVDDMVTPVAGYSATLGSNGAVTQFVNAYADNGNLWTYFGGVYDENIMASPDWSTFLARVGELTDGALGGQPV